MCPNPTPTKYATCPICHSNRQRKLLRHRKDRFIKKINCHDITFVLCESCGFTFQNPKPDQRSLEAFYQQGEFKLETSKKYFRDSRLDTQKKVAWLRSHLSKNAQSCVLEIGSSAGFLLHKLKDEGWYVFGVEPSLPFSQYARKNLGLNVKTGFFSATTFPNQTFDLIIALHVLEHSTNPVEFLNIVRSKLTKDGMLFIEVPDIFSMRADRSIFDYFCSIHMMMFTPITIQNILSKTGFQTIKCEVTDRGISVLAKPGEQKKIQKESTKKVVATLWKHQVIHNVHLLKKITKRVIHLCKKR